MKITYKKLLKLCKEDKKLRQEISFFHNYHKNILHKEKDVKHCLICLCLEAEAIIEE